MTKEFERVEHVENWGERAAFIRAGENFAANQRRAGRKWAGRPLCSHFTRYLKSEKSYSRIRLHSARCRQKR
jgi:hypothetical protein